jgi:nicotinate phosphoribosyltransferase
MVYKLVAREGPDGVMLPVAKTSPAKVGVAGRKGAGRRLDAAGRAIEEVLVVGPGAAVATWAHDEHEMRALHVPLVVGGAVDTRWTGAAGVNRAAERHQASRAELPRGARRLSADDAAIRTVVLDLDDNAR